MFIGSHKYSSGGVYSRVYTELLSVFLTLCEVSFSVGVGVVVEGGGVMTSI